MSEIEKSIEIAQLNGFVFLPSSDRSLLSESRPTASSCGVRRNVSDEPSLDEKPFRLLDKVGLFFTFDSHTVAFPYHGRLAFPGPTSRQFPHERPPYSYPRIKNALSFLHLMGLFLHFRIILDAPKTPAAPIRTPRDSV